MTLTQQQQQPTRLIPVTKWPLHHEWPSVAGLRSLIFFAKDNGFDAVVRRIGRRVLIDEAAFFEWTANQSVKPQKS
jgi:hypothetical protein